MRAIVWLPAIGLAAAIAVSAIANGGSDLASTLSIPFERYTLPNGMEVILHEDHLQPLVAVDVWYHVGAWHETKGHSGFAHLFEHMMFQGSGHVGDDQHFKILERIGASMVNGSTHFDRTDYFQTVPSNQLETALWLESDRMGFLLPTLTVEKLKTQQEVVKNERRQGLETQPYGEAEEKAWKALFPAPHPYNGMVIGSMEDLDAATVDDVKRFFVEWYTPANATLAIAGDFDPATAKALVMKYFGSLPSGPKPKAPEVAPAALTGEIVVRHEEVLGALSKVSIAWHTPAYFAPGDADADVLAALLAEGKGSRLQKRLVHDLEIAQSVSAYQMSMRGQSMFSVEVALRSGEDPERIKGEVDAALDRVRAGEVTDAEIHRAIDKIETRTMSRLQLLGGFGGRADRLQEYNHYVGDPGFLASDLLRYRSVTPATLAEFAQTYCPKDRRVVLIAIPVPKPATGAEVAP